MSPHPGPATTNTEQREVTAWKGLQSECETRDKSGTRQTEMGAQGNTK